MPLKKHFLLLFMSWIVLDSYAIDKAYMVFLKKCLEQSTQEFLSLYSLESDSKSLPKFEYSEKQIDSYLKQKHQIAYEGYHDDIGAYVDFFMSLPEQPVKVWYTMDQLYYNKLDYFTIRWKCFTRN